MNIGIIGGGASGVLCAIRLKQNLNINVTILEQNDRLLKKLMKTGNGKCNIMNKNIASNYYNDYSLIEGNNINVYQEIESLGILLKELTLGRIYPYSEQSKTVINVLLRKIKELGINVKLNEEVININKLDNLFIVKSRNNNYSFDKLIIATGSIAQEKTNGYDLIKNLGLNVSKLSPGLVPLKVYEDTKALSGLRIKTKACINSHICEGELLFKDDGISGIIVLDISRFSNVGDKISFDLMPEYTREDIFPMLKKGNLEESLEGIFPKMIALDILKRSEYNISRVLDVIKNYTFTVKGDMGFKESQITLGGVYTNEVNKNFESKKIKDLFILGEVLNVDGASGGYNLYFAWLSSIASSNYIINNLSGSES